MGLNTTRALLAQHMDECGKRYERLADDGRRMHGEIQNAVSALDRKLVDMSTTLNAAQMTAVTATAEAKIAAVHAELRNTRWLLGVSGSIVLGLFAVFSYIVEYGLPWAPSK